MRWLSNFIFAYCHGVSIKSEGLVWFHISFFLLHPNCYSPINTECQNNWFLDGVLRPPCLVGSMLVERMVFLFGSHSSNPSPWANHSRASGLVTYVHWFLPKDWQPDQNILKPASKPTIFCRMSMDIRDSPCRTSKQVLHRCAASLIANQCPRSPRCPLRQRCPKRIAVEWWVSWVQLWAKGLI